jgi:hypothetical protein
MVNGTEAGLLINLQRQSWSDSAPWSFLDCFIWWQSWNDCMTWQNARMIL